MRTLVNGEVHVHYGQIYVESDPEVCGLDLDEAFGGQKAGLCGAAVAGALWLTTGLHTGSVGFTIELHEERPTLDTSWEEIVEVPFRPLSTNSALVEWAGEGAWDLDLEEIDYRVRYCANGMQEGRDADTRLEEEPQLDRYLLQFWPSPPQPARVVKQTAEIAAYRHEHARTLPPPPTPEEKAEVERVARLEHEREAERQRLAAEKAEWGGRLPSDTLRRIQGNVFGLVEFDAALVHAIDAAGTVCQRAVARLAAHRAYTVAGLAHLNWVAPALAALEGGKPLPPPFDDQERVWELLESDPRAPQGTVGRAIPPARQHAPSPSTEEDAPQRRRVNFAPSGTAEPPPTLLEGSCPTSAPREGGSRRLGRLIATCQVGGEPQVSAQVVVTAGRSPLREPVKVSQPHMAVPALFGAAEADPLQAALDAVYAAIAAYGEDYPSLLDEVWTTVHEQGRGR
ncbi:hypothetical protein ACFVRD_07265 [Streptomyces sp. NPDC057908]|uniref:hypothetical protein n=1 Tax=Streptomyces sp. NPDC057908 TaxID=3346276 RepID=UPI0036F10A98